MESVKPIAESKTWPLVRLTVKPSKSSLDPTPIASSMTPEKISIGYYENEKAVMFFRDGSGVEFPTSDIRSLELQTYAEFYGSGGKPYATIVDEQIGGKRFAEEICIPYEALNTQSTRPEVAPAYLFNAAIFGLGAVIYFVASVFVAYLVLDLLFVVNQDSNPMLSGWWRDHHVPKPLAILIWVAFWLGVLGISINGGKEALKVFTSRGIDGRKIIREPHARFFFDKDQYYFVVIHFVTGKSQPIAATYGDLILAREIHADHMNAWTKAKLETNTTPDDESGDYV